MRKSKNFLKFIFAMVLGISFASTQLSGQKIDVWDFGGEKLDTAIYINLLDTAVINSWYTYTGTQVHGGTGRNLPLTFTVGKLTWVTNSATSDRLRTTNTLLTRYDANIANVVGYTGRIYVNSSANIARYLSLTLGEDDEVTLISRSDATGRINFVYVANPAAQTDLATNATGAAGEYSTHKFVAKQAGVYRIYDNLNKPSYYRVYRKNAQYVTITGTMDVTQAPGIPAGYGINFTNAAGKTWNSVINSNSYSITVPAGYSYTLSLSNAGGYIVTNENPVSVTESTTTINVNLLKVDLYNVGGTITGLSAANLAKLSLTYSADTAAHKIYVPKPVVNAAGASYAVQLEANCEYEITAQGVNDYYIPKDTLTIMPKDTLVELAFLPKPVYAVTINTTGLTTDQTAKLGLTFTNLNEAGYTYTFSSISGITLRDGTYSIAYSGLDSVPVQLGLTSNLKVAGAAVVKSIDFVPVTTWSFDDKELASGSKAYKGMLFTGTVLTESKGHLVANPGATIRIPVKVGDRLKVTYYYRAAFIINTGDTIKTTSNSTGTFENVDYVYTGAADGFDTIKIITIPGATTTYITEISKYVSIGYEPVIYVGTDKQYKTINAALDAIGKMTRSNTDRVTVMIDPGNYEEMLVVSQANVTLKNAAASPSIALSNKGVDIDANAVRITSYYGHGYNYYSMKNNQKWDADALRVNKENAYTSYTNTGAGTTNGSYWNSTVVISANGFEAENIIFENSFNQYISKKESEDVIVMWESGNKGLRPTEIGNTSVQERSFVERAAAIAITDNTDKVVLTKCRVIGRQDSFYGGKSTRVVVFKGAMMGAVDYIFGGMTAVFYKTDLVMNTSDASVDAAYLTAAQQTSGRGYLMYNCNVKSTVPGIESASTYYAKPGLFGRPWQSNTSEVVFYNTIIDTSNFPGSVGKSLITPEGWSNSLGGESNMMYEYGTVEKSGENNLASRVAWSTVLTEDTLTDGTAITTYNFTKGNDGWDPIPALIEANKMPLTITADNKTKVYGAAVSELTISYSGFEDGDDASVLDTAAEVSSDVTVATAAGDYPIVVSGAYSVDYSITYVNGTFTVEKADLTVTAEDKTKEFGAANPEFTVNYAGFVNGDDISDITAPTVACTATETSPAGDYDITLSGGSATNYELILVNGTLTITPSLGIIDRLTTGLNIFPNPASSIININREISEPVIVRILNNAGQVIIEQNLVSDKETIDVSDLSKGLYILKIEDKSYSLVIN